MAYLYILCHDTEPRLKVGKSNSPTQRIAALSLLSSLDLTRSHQLEVPDPVVFKLEKLLHTMLSSYRVSGLSGDGATEWFHTECYEKLLRHVGFLAKEEGYVLTAIPVQEARLEALKKSTVRKAKSKQRKPIRLESAREFRSFLDTCHDLLFVIDYPDQVKLGFCTRTPDAAQRLDFWFVNEEPEHVPDGLLPGVGHDQVEAKGRGLGKPVTESYAPLLLLGVRGHRFGCSIVSGHCVLGDKTSDEITGYLSLGKMHEHKRDVCARVSAYVLNEFLRYGIPHFDADSQAPQVLAVTKLAQRRIFDPLG